MLENIVTDWGGFEQLVASLNETGNVSVEHNVTLVGKSGAPRQVDVLLRHKQGLYEHLVIVECKWLATPVERLHIDALATTVRELGASRGVIFSRKGFQSGALAQAKHENIDLFQVRDLTHEEWGLPGRVIDLFLQFVQISIGNPDLVAPVFISKSPEIPQVAFNLGFGPDGPTSKTPLLNSEQKISSDSLEMKIFEASQRVLKQTILDVGVFNGGEKRTFYMSRPVNLQSENRFMVPQDNGVLAFEKMTFDLGIRIDQSRITIDRAEKLSFAVAIENCVTQTVTAAYREKDAVATNLSHIMLSKVTERDDAVENGTIIRIFMKGMFSFDEVRNLQPVLYEQNVQPFVYQTPTLEK